VKNVTVGIRGTDLWGKSTPERDWVVLLEGKINVGSEGNPTVTLDKPLDFYQRPRDAAPEVSKADAKVVEEWAKETEMSSDGAAASKAGRWRVVAAVKPKREDARAGPDARRGLPGGNRRQGQPVPGPGGRTRRRSRSESPHVEHSWHPGSRPAHGARRRSV
jgi:hypothetical protein